MFFKSPADMLQRSWVGVAVGVASTAYKVYDSAKKSKEAKKMAAENQRPIYKAGQEIDDVYNIAVSNVNGTEMQDYITDSLGRNQSAGIDAILKSGGKADFGVINENYGTQLQAALGMLTKTRDTRIAALNNAAYNKAMAGDTEFQYNKDAPYKDKKQQEASLRQDAEQSKADAINTGISTVGNYLTATTSPGGYEEKQIRKENREMNRELRKNSSMDRTTATPELATPQPAASGLRVGGGDIVVSFDPWGNAIYG